MITQRRKFQRGSAVLESGLVLIPLLLTIFAILDLSRAMWTYHTVAMAVKSGMRMSIVHGARCAEASQACPISVAAVVSAIQRSGIGLDPGSLQVTLNSGSQAISCSPSSSCASNGTVWPSAPNNAVGQPLTITAQYNFVSVLPFLMPPGGVGLSATSTEVIQF